VFDDRVDAGRRLAKLLRHLRGEPVVVLGLSRGGVPVAAEVAAELHAPLEVSVVRKLGLPYQPELGMGAIGEDGVQVLDDEIVRLGHVTDRELRRVEERERAELERRVRLYRGDRPRARLDGRIAIVVDDGIATGSTARAACQAARAQGAARVVLAVPVAPPDWRRRLAGVADEYVCVVTPDGFRAVGQVYSDFSQVSDDAVMDCLDRAARAQSSPATAERGIDRGGYDEEVVIDAGGVPVPGHLTVPVQATGVVLFAHGSGSSRHSPRNRFVADVLNEAGLGTLLFDLLVPSEETDRANVFDIRLLAGRLTGATRWLRAQRRTAELPVGYFGASTGAAAALWAAAEPDADIAAVVSRGGRPDLAGPRLTAVQAPTLLVVGGQDHVVLEMNRAAQAQLRCPNQLAVIPGATHLFEEPGTLQAAAEAARRWFTTYMPRAV
jgi:putative phosphoribosyl transferase